MLRSKWLGGWLTSPLSPSLSLRPSSSSPPFVMWKSEGRSESENHLHRVVVTDVQGLDTTQTGGNIV